MKSIRAVVSCLLLVSLSSGFCPGFYPQIKRLSKISQAPRLKLRPVRAYVKECDVKSLVPGHHLYRQIGVDPDLPLDKIVQKVDELRQIYKSKEKNQMFDEVVSNIITLRTKLASDLQDKIHRRDRELNKIKSIAAAQWKRRHLVDKVSQHIRGMVQISSKEYFLKRAVFIPVPAMLQYFLKSRFTMFRTVLFVTAIGAFGVIDRNRPAQRAGGDGVTGVEMLKLVGVSLFGVGLSMGLYLAVSPLFIPELFSSGEPLDKALRTMCLTAGNVVQSCLFNVYHSSTSQEQTSSTRSTKSVQTSP